MDLKDGTPKLRRSADRNYRRLAFRGFGWKGAVRNITDCAGRAMRIIGTNASDVVDGRYMDGRFILIQCYVNSGGE